MTKTIKILSSICCLLGACLLTFPACSTSTLRYVYQLSYIEWRDDDGKFSFRTVNNAGYGCGTIVLNGEKLEAGFSVATNPPCVCIDITAEAAKKLGVSTHSDSGGIESDGFTAYYSKEEQVIYSESDDVVLFGVNVGKVKLKAYPVDKSTVKIWEILSSWSDSDNRLSIYNSHSNYFYYKCLNGEVRQSDGKLKNITFRWLPETSRFLIYDYIEWYDYSTITDDTVTLAEGTYEQHENNVTLYFVKDDLLGLQNQYISLLEIV